MHSELPPRKERPLKSGEIDSSRRNFFFGLSGKSAEKRGESEERRLSETCSQASRVSDRPKTGVEEESTVHLARRRFINTVSGVLAGALVLDKTADIIDRERKRAPFACFVFTAR